MDEYMTYEDAEDAQKNYELKQLVKQGIINPEPVFDLIGFHKVFGHEDEDEILQNPEFAPAYARKVEEEL